MKASHVRASRLGWNYKNGLTGGSTWALRVVGDGAMDYLFWFSVFFLALIGALYIFGIIVRAVREWLYWRKMGV